MRLRRGIATMVALCLLLAAFAAQAASKTVYVKANSVKVYASASTSSKRLGTMNFGEAMGLVKKSGSWAKVKNASGAVGFCKYSALTTNDPSGSAKTYYAKSAKATVYCRASTSSSVLKTYAANDPVSVVATTTDKKWFRVEFDDAYGFVQCSALSKTKVEDPTTDQISGSAAVKTVYVKANSVKVYASASTSSKRLGTIYFGEAMGLVKKSGSWAKVKNASGEVGYCKYSALTTNNPNGSEKTYYAKSTGVTVYARTSASSSAVKTYSVNDPVSVVAATTDKKWFRVKFDDVYGFVQCSALSKTKVEVPTTVYISANTTVAYKSKSTSSAKLGTFSYGETLTRVKTEGSWAQVKNANGKTGYMKNSALTTTNPNGDAETWYAATSASLRAMPKAGAKQLTALDKGDSLDVVAATTDGKWVRAEVEGVYGYVESAKLTDDAPSDGDDSVPAYDDEYRGTARAELERVIALAIQQLGKKYVYAAEGPNTYDCSGLTCYCFSKEAGVSLKRSAYAQGYDGRFQKIESVDALKRGDIVCFDTVLSDVDISDHVGIYLGGGKFIHASSGAGQVIMSSITSGYYFRQFSWGLRILN